MCGGLFEPSQQTSKSSSTTTHGPSQQYQNVYSNLLSQAQGVAGAAYDPATEQQVAGFAQPTYDAFQGVYGNQGIASPYMQNAFGYAQQGAGPSYTNVDAYMNPYTQNVVNATQQQFDTQNARQINDVRANLAKTGALGGSGRLVSEALTKEAQMNAQNPVIAGLYSQGYSQALNAAQTDAARQLSAAGVMGSLGGQAQQYGYNDVNALLGIGGLQQQQSQSVLDAATANAQQRAAYPYQNLQWLSGIASGLGSASGGTQTTKGTQTTPGPSVGQQLIGGGLAALSFMSNGGRVGYEGGGVVAPFGGTNSYIPQIGMTQGSGPTPSLAEASGTPPASNGMGDLLSSYKQAHSALSGIGRLGEKMRTTTDAGTGWSTTVNPSGFGGWGNYLGNAFGFSHGGGVGRLGYADGGDVLDMEDDGTGTYTVPEVFLDDPDLFGNMSWDAVPGANYSTSVAPTGVAAMAPVAADALPVSSGVAPVTTPEAAEQGGGLFGWSPEARQALLHAGLGIMASQSPNVGVALGQGGLMGAKSYQQALADTEAKKIQRDRLAQSSAALQQRAQQAAEALKLRREQHGLEQQYKTAQIAQMQADLAKGDIQQVGNRLVRLAPDGSVTEIYAGPAAETTKAPDVVEIFDDQGRKQKAMWDAAAGKYVPIGGAAATNPGATVLDREQAKADVKRVNEYKDASDAASDMRGNLANLKAARAETTREGPWLGMLPNWSSESQRVAAEAENVRLSFVGKTKGAVSDSEMRIFGQATPGMDMRDEAAAPIIDGMELAAMRTQERAIFFDTWLRSRRNLDGAPQAWKKFMDTHPIIEQGKNGKYTLKPENVDNWRAFIPADTAGSTTGVVPDEAVQELLSDPSPEAQAEFDEIFGDGSAQSIIEGQ